MMNKPAFDSHYNIKDSGLTAGTVIKYVPWQFGVIQGIQAKKVRASSGFFKKLSGGTNQSQNISMATITLSLFNGGTVANASIQNGTFPNLLITGGTINNVLMGTPAITGGTMNSAAFGTPTITGGTINNAVVGTPSVTGGTINAGTYQVGGSAGLTGSIIYIKTVDFIGQTTTLGTLSFIGGIITRNQ